MPKMKMHIFHLLCIIQGVYSQTFDFKSGIIFQSTLNNELESGHRWEVDGSLTISESEVSHFLPYVSIRLAAEICKIWIYPSSSCSQAPIDSDTGSVQCYCSAYSNGQYTLKISAVAKTEQSGLMVSAELTPSVTNSHNTVVAHVIGQLPVIYGKDGSRNPIKIIARRESLPDTEAEGKGEAKKLRTENRDPNTDEASRTESDDPTYDDVLYREIRQADNDSVSGNDTTSGNATLGNGTTIGNDTADGNGTAETSTAVPTTTVTTVPITAAPTTTISTTIAPTTTVRTTGRPTPAMEPGVACPHWVADAPCEIACGKGSIKVHDSCRRMGTKEVPCQNLPPCPDTYTSFNGGGLWTGLIVILGLSCVLAIIAYCDKKRTATRARLAEQEEANRPKNDGGGSEAADNQSQTKPANKETASVGKADAADAEAGSIQSSVSVAGAEPQPAE